jgi:glyoxylase-like metal-dependent hydrolase (beta-lactamase superfamily II)
MKPVKIAPHVHYISLGFVNAYAVTNLEDDWVLIDSGLKINFAALKTLEDHFGKPPLGIVLTHGHLDHVGSASQLATLWGIKIYAHKLERPFLVGKSTYPPQDPTVGGALAQLTRVMPMTMFNLTGQLENFPEGDRVPFLPDWQIIETPGHSPGHVSFWHETDRVLIAGDALCTADMDSVVGMTTQKKEFARGGSPFTFDWEKSRHSVGILADLEPVVVGAGHGQPISGADTPQQLRDFFHNFTPPAHGRYVQKPAEADENGITYLPPKPEDDFGRNAAAVVGAATVLTVGAKLLSRLKEKERID